MCRRMLRNDAYDCHGCTEELTIPQFTTEPSELGSRARYVLAVDQESAVGDMEGADGMDNR